MLNTCKTPALWLLSDVANQLKGMLSTVLVEAYFSVKGLVGIANGCTDGWAQSCVIIPFVSVWVSLSTLSSSYKY